MYSKMLNYKVLVWYWMRKCQSILFIFINKGDIPSYVQCIKYCFQLFLFVYIISNKPTFCRAYIKSCILICLSWLHRHILNWLWGFSIFSVFVSYYNVEKDIKDIQKKKILNIFKNLSLFNQIFIFSQFELELEIQE